MKTFNLLKGSILHMLVTNFLGGLNLFLKRKIHVNLNKIKVVDVLIPTRGENESYLSNAIYPFRFNIFVKSIVIIVDSKDESVSENIKRNFGNVKKLQVYKSPGSGISRTLNFGVTKCNAKLIARQDDDDISSSLRIYLQLFALLITRSDLVFTNLKKIDTKGNRLSKLEYRRPMGRVYPIGIFLGCIVSHATVLGKRDIFYNNKFTHDILAEDYDLWMRIIDKVKFINLDFKLYKFRIHDRQITNTNSTIDQHVHLYDCWVDLGTRIGIDQKILKKDIFLIPYTDLNNPITENSNEFKLFKSECAIIIEQLPKKVGNYYKTLFQELYL